MWVVLALFVACFFGVVAWWYLKVLHYRKYLKRYRGPGNLPVIGAAHHFGSLPDFIPTIMKMHEDYGPSFATFIGFIPQLVISDVRLVEFLLSSQVALDKSQEYRYFHNWLGTGLLTSSSSKWKKHRKMLTPAFHFQILELFVSTFNTVTDTLVEKLRGEVDKKATNVFPYISLSALDVICEASMGTSVNALGDSESEYVKSVKTQCRIVMERAFSAIKSFDVLFKLTGDYRTQKRCIKVLHDYTNFVIKKRRQEFLDMPETAGQKDMFGVKKRTTFLDLLLQSQIDGEGLSDETIREEVDTFMFEGHDTTTSGISFALYCLSKNQEVQRKVMSELDDIFGKDRTCPATYADLQNMKYLELVIKESLRLYPSVPMVARELTEDVEYDGEILPKGLSMTVFIYALHRNPQFFPEPEKFDPERFTSENSQHRPPFAYIPFSAGPRNCIGQKFAMLEMKATISKVLRNFEILPTEHKPILLAQAILNSANGIEIRLRHR